MNRTALVQAEQRYLAKEDLYSSPLFNSSGTRDTVPLLISDEKRLEMHLLYSPIRYPKI